MKLKLLFLLFTVYCVVTYSNITIPNYSDQNVVTFNYHIGLEKSTYSGYSVDDIQRVRLQFSTEAGFIRPLLLGFTPNNAATDGFDYGYDALSPDHYANDMFWDIEGQDYVIQGVGAFDVSKTYPLNINITDAGTFNIALTALENFHFDLNVFLYDSELKIYTAINDSAFSIDLEAGIYDGRFFIAFMAVDALSIPSRIATSVVVNYLIGSSEIYITSAALSAVKKIHLFNVFGQSQRTLMPKDFNLQDGALRIPVDTMAEGIYIVQIETHNAVVNKKIVIAY